MNVPPGYLINLEKSRDRLERFFEFNRGVESVTRFSAVEGESLDRDALISSGYITSDLPYGPGTLGCAMSHIKLWEMAAAEDRSITIFEDDVVISHRFYDRANEIMSRLPPDWDTIQWGCLFNPHFAWLDLGNTRARVHVYGSRRYNSGEELRQFQEEECAPGIVKMLHSFGLYGYSISAQGARAALDFCLPLRNRLIEFPDAGVRTWDTGIDVTLCGFYPTRKAYVCIPVLVQPNLGHSVRQSLDAR